MSRAQRSTLEVEEEGGGSRGEKIKSESDGRGGSKLQPFDDDLQSEGGQGRSTIYNLISSFVI